MTGPSDATPPPDEEVAYTGALAFVLALATFVVLGYFFKSLVLNWIVGPAYLVVVLHVIPTAVHRRRRRANERAPS